MIAKKSSGAGCRLGLSATGIRSVEYQVDSAETPQCGQRLEESRLRLPGVASNALVSPESPGWLQALQQNSYYGSHTEANLPVRPELFSGGLLRGPTPTRTFGFLVSILRCGNSLLSL